VRLIISQMRFDLHSADQSADAALCCVRQASDKAFSPPFVALFRPDSSLRQKLSEISDLIPQIGFQTLRADSSS